MAVNRIDTHFIFQNATKILERTPIEYLKDVRLVGSLFDKNCTTEAVSCADTHFYVDHKEPLAALDAFKAARGWCLGELLEGHEFLIIISVDS